LINLIQISKKKITRFDAEEKALEQKRQQKSIKLSAASPMGNVGNLVTTVIDSLRRWSPVKKALYGKQILDLLGNNKLACLQVLG
jgi:hypothetical protein